MNNFIQDITYALRALRKSPVYAIIAIITLALGIGANTAIFSYVNAWLIKPLAYPQADRLMVLLSHDTKQGWTSNGVTSTADFLDYEKQDTAFEELASWTPWFFNLTSDGQPERVAGGLVSWNFFQTLGATPMLGRVFLPEESQPASSHVAILSRGLWQSRYAGDPQIIGRSIKLQGETYTVVGVMPASFQFSLMGIANIWTPLALDEKQQADRVMGWFSAFGRLKPGVTQAQAAAEITGIASRLEKLYPQTNTNATTLLSSMTFEIGKNEGTQQVMILFWIVGLVLLIACANVANLMLARAARRTKEFAVRSALGASRARLARQLLTESLVLFTAGGAAGVLFALWGVHWIADSIPARIRGYLVNYGRVDVDFNTLAYTLGIALVCGIIFGLVPAFESTGLDVNGALKESASQASGSRRGAWLRRGFVAGEIALAVVVLISTAMLVESFVHMVFGSLGFQPANVVTAPLVIPKSKYAGDPQVRNFYDQVMARVHALPGVVSAGASQYVPFGESSSTVVIHVTGRPPAQPGEEIGALYSAATPDYFSTMQIPLIRGRLFGSGDGEGAPNVILIDETLMRQQFANEDPIGKQMDFGDKHTVGTIVGVVGDVKMYSTSDRPHREMYVPSAQFPSAYMSIVARTAGPAPDLPAAIRNAVWTVDSEQPISLVQPYDDVISEQNAGNRILTQLAGFFGVVAMLLGAIGIYGVMSYTVEQRTREMGIRMALGASPGDVTRIVLWQGLKLSLVGVVIGMIVAAGTTRGMVTLLYNVKAGDPITFFGVAAFFTLVALAACYIPARRAMRVDPMVALRYQ
ncbi:MAG: ABC transporter permease [Candidatus Acidiferrales bacterium]|jgi:predicted permease